MTTPPPIDDETLMAFADGRLDEPLFSLVADAVETDETLAGRLEQLVQGAVLARAGYEPLLAPVPAALETQVRQAIAQAGRKSIWQGLAEIVQLRPLTAAMALAASVVVVALPAGFLLARASAVPTGLDMFAAPAITAALDDIASGESRQVGNVTLTPIATFTDAEGTVCREVEASGFVAVACRAEGHWQTRFAVASDATDDAAYRPASGLAALDAYLMAIGAGAPLLDDEERRALSQEPARP